MLARIESEINKLNFPIATKKTSILIILNLHLRITIKFRDFLQTASMIDNLIIRQNLFVFFLLLYKALRFYT